MASKYLFGGDLFILQSFMRPMIPIAFVLFNCPLLSGGQDTIKTEPSRHYSSKTEPSRGKGFASRVKYAKEEIVFSETRRQIDYCYYYDNERVCFGDTYELKADSILKINDEEWVYDRQGDQYYLHRYYQGLFESGYAKTLIPFGAAGLFVTTSADKKDTLWTTDYFSVNPANPFDSPTWTRHKTKIAGKVYSADKVDEAPAFLNGDSILAIKVRHGFENCVCYGEPLVTRRKMSFVITSTGQIVNMEDYSGNICHCDIIGFCRNIYQLAPVRPAKRKGKNVNVRWVVRIDFE